MAVNQIRNHGVWQLYRDRASHADSGSRALGAFRRNPMQELVLIQPGSAARSEWVREAAQADARREFEERLRECGQLASLVSRVVLRYVTDTNFFIQITH